MHSFAILFQQWRYLFLLGSLLLLLVIQPIMSGFGTVEWLFNALFVFVLTILVLALAREKVWRVIAYALSIPAALLLIGSYFLTASAHDISLFAGHMIGALFFVLVTGKIIQSILFHERFP